MKQREQHANELSLEFQSAKPVSSAHYYLKAGAVILATGAVYAIAKTAGAWTWLWAGLTASGLEGIPSEEKSLQVASSAIQASQEAEPLLISPLKPFDMSVTSRRVEALDSLELAELDRVDPTALTPVSTKLSPTRRRLTTAMLADDIQVNTQTIFDQQQPAVAAMDNGDFVVTWQSYLQDGSGWGIIAQIFNETGGKVGGEIVVNTDTYLNQVQPTIMGFSNGNFMIAWLNRPNTPSFYATIEAQLFNASGSFLGSQFSITQRFPNTLAQVSVSNKQQTLVSWDGGFRFYDMMGTPLSSHAMSYDPPFSIAPLAYNAGFAVVFSYDGDTFILSCVLDISGTQIGQAVTVSYVYGNYLGGVKTIGLPSGNYAAIWCARPAGYNAPPTDTFLQCFNVMGQPITSIITISDTVNQFNPDMMLSNDNSYFMIVWHANDRYGSGNEIYAALFDLNCQKIGEEILVNDYEPGDQNRPAIASLANNSTVIAWTDSSGRDGSGAGIYLRLLIPGNVPPILEINRLSIDQGGSVILDSSCLDARDLNVGYNSSDLQVIFSALTHINFMLSNASNISIHACTLADIKTGQILAVADDTPFLPSYQVSLNNSKIATPPFRAVIDFNQKPVWVTNQLIINQGEHMLVPNSMIRVTDDQPTSQSEIQIINMQNGHFELASSPDGVLTMFTQEQIDNLQIVFVSDTSNSAPSYNLIVSDGRITLPASATSIHFNEKPLLVNNQWGFFQGETTIITTTMLSAIDYLQPSSALNMIVSNVLHGHFEVITTPQVAITQFLQQQMTAGQIQFVADGSAIAPSFSISLSNPLRTTTPVPAAIQFNQKPVLVNNQWSINQNQRLLVTPSMLNASDDGSAAGLTYSIVSPRASQFEWTLNQGTAIEQFTQQQIMDSQILWVADDSGSLPGFQFNLSDGHFNLPTVSASVTFNRRPLLTLNLMDLNQGQSAVLTAQIFNVTDDSPASQLTFTLSQLQYVQFNPVSFTQQQLLAGQASVIPDDSINAPSYEVSVSDGYFSLPAVAAPIRFNQRPRIIRNQFMVEQAQTLPLTLLNLQAADDNPLDQLTFTVSNLNHVGFESTAFPGSPVTQFTFPQLQNGTIYLIPDGSSQAPSGFINLSDGILASTPVALGITFNQQPILITNRLSISQGQTVTITSALLNVQDDNLPNELTYTISAPSACQFELIASPGLTITTFTQTQVLAQTVCIVHDGSVQPASYLVSVSDGALFSTPAPAAVSFNHRPTISLNQFTLLQGEQKPISSAMLQIEDLDNTPDQLQVTFSDALQIRFFLTNNLQISSLQFTQQDVISGRVSMKHDNGELAPSWRITVSDPDMTLAPVIANVNFLKVNQAPVMTGATDALLYDQPGASLVLDPQLTVTDVDSPLMHSAMVVITDNRNIAEDNLGVENGQGISGHYDTGSATLTLSGTATLASYQEIMRSIAYKNSAKSPNLQPRRVAMTVNDGELNSLEYARVINIATEAIAACYLKSISAIPSLKDGSFGCYAVNTLFFTGISTIGSLVLSLLWSRLSNCVRDREWRKKKNLTVHDALRKNLKLELAAPHDPNAAAYIAFVSKLLGELLEIKMLPKERDLEYDVRVGKQVEGTDEKIQKNYVDALQSAFREEMKFRSSGLDCCWRPASADKPEMPMHRYFFNIFPSVYSRMTTYEFDTYAAEAVREKIIKHARSTSGFFSQAPALLSDSKESFAEPGDSSREFTGFEIVAF